MQQEDKKMRYFNQNQISLATPSLTFTKRSLYSLVGMFSLIISHQANAHPEHVNILKEWCSEAGRTAPTFSSDVCSTCHNTSNYKFSTANKEAFSTKNLDPFCPSANPTVSVYEWRDPKVPPVSSSRVHNIELVAQEKQIAIAAGVSQQLWTFNGTAPGPVIRVHLGDTIRVHLVNPATNKLSHSVDFHASEMAWNMGGMTSIKPGEEKFFEWKANYAGVWMYHCGTPPTLHHIASGMYGMVIVEPKGGLAPVDHEFALVQSEFYTGSEGGITSLARAAKGNASPNYVVFNGVAFQYKDHPIEVATGKKVRFFVLNAGPSQDSAFHIVGTIFNRVIKEGVQLSPSNTGGYGSQAVDLAPAQGAIIELTTAEDGLYPIVTHAFNYVGLGAMGLLKSGDGDPSH
ncbi:MAG: hypothetical protein RL637_486 [Pseudomonadota bacterium]|jgi:nitrite reductase (NO-forming)